MQAANCRGYFLMGCGLQPSPILLEIAVSVKWMDRNVFVSRGAGEVPGASRPGGGKREAAVISANDVAVTGHHFKVIFRLRNQESADIFIDLVEVTSLEYSKS